MLRSLSEQNGFTLLELVIVITIILLLAAVAVPRVMDFGASAEAAACKSNQNNIEFALTMYAAEVHNSIAMFPMTLDVLVPNFLQYVPECPSGGAYDYNEETGLISCFDPDHDRF